MGIILNWCWIRIIYGHFQPLIAYCGNLTSGCQRYPLIWFLNNDCILTMRQNKIGFTKPLIDWQEKWLKAQPKLVLDVLVCFIIVKFHNLGHSQNPSACISCEDIFGSFPLIRPIFAPWICVPRALNPPAWMEVFPWFRGKWCRKPMETTSLWNIFWKFWIAEESCLPSTLWLSSQRQAGRFFNLGHNKPADVSKAKVDMLATWSQTENMVGLLVTGCCMNGTKKWGSGLSLQSPEQSCIFRMVKLPREPAFAGLFPGIDHPFFWRISGVNQNQSDTYHILCTIFSVYYNQRLKLAVERLRICRLSRLQL